MILFMNGAMKLMKNKEAVMIKAVNVEKQYIRLRNMKHI